MNFDEIFKNKSYHTYNDKVESFRENIVVLEE